jgi:UDP-N-acetylglucosamine--dolichyl-phosphate N-acetylglucosaminephosphotransferase
MIWLLVLAAVSFLVTFLTLPSWIGRAKKSGFTGKDVHKKDKAVAELGGVSVILGSLISILLYIAIETFYFSGDSLSLLLASIASMLIATIIGMTDDMLGWRIGLRQKEKVLLTFLVPIPMMVVNAGHSIMDFPFFGRVELGLIYPMVIIPLGVIGSTNGFNMLAGFNGLEAGMGIIIFSALGYLAWQLGEISAVVIAMSFIAALLAFLFYNKYPSRVFPGDVLTYPVGASIAVVAILANLERFALMLFIPYYFEFFLKARGKFRSEWEGELLIDGSLSVKDRIFSFPHVSMHIIRKLKGRAYEYEVVRLILVFELIIALITVYTF